ncbi:UBP19, partial [Symbiodinium sp. CCMP2456]
MALINYATSNCAGPGSVWWQTPFGLGPEEEKHFLRCSVHDRTRLAGELSAVSGIFPPWVYCYHGVRLLIYALSCCLHVGYAICACRVDLQHALLSAFARVTLWTAVLEICGFCNMTGPLGRNQSWLEPLWYRLTAGTLKQPLLPFAALPRKRGPADQLLFLLYLCSASAFLISPLPLDENLVKLRLTVLLLTLLCLLDRTAYTGPAGCQLVQLAHLFMPGVAKMGPWFPEVLPSMVGFCPFLPQCLKEKMFRRDAGGGLQFLRFSPAAGMASVCVVLLEIVCPGFLVCSWERLQTTGVVLAVGLHLCIVFLMPPGAVGEWNLFNAASTAYLFGMMKTQPLQSDPGILASPLMIFVALMVLGGPLLANLRPDAVGNHFALRKYTGNHPYHTFLIPRSATWKMKKFKTFAPLASVPPSARAELLSRAAFHSLVRGRLNLRRALDILVLALPAGALEDVVWFDLGFLLSQTLLDVSFLDRQLLAELGQCFEAGELYSFRVSSFPTFTRWPHRAPWELLDVGAELVVASGHVRADETFECDTSRLAVASETFVASHVWDLPIPAKAIYTPNLESRSQDLLHLPRMPQMPAGEVADSLVLVEHPSPIELIRSFVVLSRLGIAIMLGTSGGLWLALTRDVTNIMLNAVALLFVLEIDDLLYKVLAPKHAIKYLASVREFEVGHRKTWAGVDMSCVVKVTTLVLTLGCFIRYTVWENAVQADHARRLLCGGNQDFVYGSHPSLGPVFVADTLPFDQRAANMLPGMRPLVNQVVFNYNVADMDKYMWRKEVNGKLLAVKHLPSAAEMEAWLHMSDTEAPEESAFGSRSYGTFCKDQDDPEWWEAEWIWPTLE